MNQRKKKTSHYVSNSLFAFHMSTTIHLCARMNILKSILFFVSKWSFFFVSLFVVICLPIVVFDMFSLSEEFSEKGVKAEGVVVDAEYSAN